MGSSVKPLKAEGSSESMALENTHDTLEVLQALTLSQQTEAPAGLPRSSVAARKRLNPSKTWLRPCFYPERNLFYSIKLRLVLEFQ